MIEQVDGDHYAAEVQHWDYVDKVQAPYLEGCASKYLVRWRQKNGLVDLKKALSYAKKRLEEYSILIGPTRGAIKDKILFRNFITSCNIPSFETSIIDKLLHWTYIGSVEEAAEMIQELIAEQEGDPTNGYVNQDR